MLRSSPVNENTPQLYINVKCLFKKVNLWATVIWCSLLVRRKPLYLHCMSKSYFYWKLGHFYKLFIWRFLRETWFTHVKIVFVVSFYPRDWILIVLVANLKSQRHFWHIFERSKFLRSLVHKKNLGLMWLAVVKLEYIWYLFWVWINSFELE